MSRKNEWVICPNGCGARLYFREVTLHTQTACPERLEPCTTGCGEFVRYKDRHKHKVTACTFRTVPCEHAPMCRWTGRLVDLAVHLDEQLSSSEKLAKVPGDPNIECMYRSYTCWHPPLIAPKEEGTFRIRWPGCGKRVRFGDRERHDRDECPLRMHQCTLCAQTIIGFRVEEHYKGRPPDRCVDTKAWVESGCLERVLPCQFIFNTPKDKKEKTTAGTEASGPFTRKDARGAGALSKQPSMLRQKSSQKQSSRSLTRSGTSGKLSKSSSHKKSLDVGSETSDEDERSRSPMSQYAPREREEQERALQAVEVRVEKGCKRQLKAEDMLLHQESACPERFVLCKHDCGTLVKARDLYAHEDDAHRVQTDLHLAAGDGDMQRVREHVEGLEGARKFSVRVRDELGNSAVHYAIHPQPYPQIVHYLLAHSADPDAPGGFGRTPLMAAAMVGHVGVMEQLLRAGAGLEARDTLHGWRPLHYAAFHRQEGAVTALVGARAEVNAADGRRGDTALHFAMIAQHDRMVETLLAAGADVNARNKRRVNVFYHSFNKASGRPQEVRRGDVPFDLARSDPLRSLAAPSLLDDELHDVSAKTALDPLYGNTFTTTKTRREPSPTKEMALGRSVSPTSREASVSPTLRKSKSPSRAAAPSGAQG